MLAPTGSWQLRSHDLPQVRRVRLPHRLCKACMTYDGKGVWSGSGPGAAGELIEERKRVLPLFFFFPFPAPPGRRRETPWQKTRSSPSPPALPPTRRGSAWECLAAVNGHPIVDVLDYKYHSYDPENLTPDLRGGGSAGGTGQGRGGGFGPHLATYLMDRPGPQANHCVFLLRGPDAAGMRESLYFKDDDACLSFLMATTSPSPTSAGGSCGRSIDRISPSTSRPHHQRPVACRWGNHRRANASKHHAPPSPRRGS